jgi:signal transduction histidine kinase
MQAEVAHEIKNPLAAILLQAQIAQRGGADAGTREFAARVERAAKKIQKIIDGVQALARDSEDDPVESVTVSRILDDAAEVSQWTLSDKKIPLLVSATETNAVVRCRPSQICQVLVNLIHNARDAIEHLNGPWIRLRAEESPRSISLSVTDAGGGISAEIREHLMEPYFTTKPKGKGTGLGFSISKRIAERHGGALFLDTSVPNTCFRLELPKAIPV